jgi:hypothetical protein
MTQEKPDTKLETLKVMSDAARLFQMPLDKHLQVQNDLIAITVIVEEYLKNKHQPSPPIEG